MFPNWVHRYPQMKLNPELFAQQVFAARFALSINSNIQNGANNHGLPCHGQGYPPNPQSVHPATGSPAWLPFLSGPLEQLLLPAINKHYQAFGRSLSQSKNCLRFLLLLCLILLLFFCCCFLLLVLVRCSLCSSACWVGGVNQLIELFLIIIAVTNTDHSFLIWLISNLTHF